MMVTERAAPPNTGHFIKDKHLGILRAQRRVAEKRGDKRMALEIQRVIDMAGRFDFGLLTADEKKSFPQRLCDALNYGRACESEGPQTGQQK